MEALLPWQAAGMQEITMSLAWDELEKTPGQYDSKLLTTGNSFYPAKKTKVSLVIPVIDTNNLRLPGYLKGKRFDDPLVIARFNNLMNWVFKQIPDLSLSCLVIGNEVDAYLSGDKDKWNQYRRFVDATSNYARGLRSNLLVGCKTTFDGTIYKYPEEIRQLNKNCDALMVTYYPLQSSSFAVRSPQAVFSDFARLVTSYPQKPIFVPETGYPSSPLINGSEQKQAEFVHNIFRVWDTFDSHIKLVEFLWLNDLTQAEGDTFAKYYRSSDSQMQNFLGSLGLRTADGKDKRALLIFRQEAKQRGL